MLDPGVRVVMRELRGRSGPATKTRDSDGGVENNICESNQKVLITPNVHIHMCARCMNPQESDEGERQYEAQMYGVVKHSLNKLPV